MRRSRFARAVGTTGEARDRASVGEAMWFDIRSPDTSGDESLAAGRIAALDHCALLLGSTHALAWAASLLFHSRGAADISLANPLLPLSALLVLDGVAALGLHLRDRLGFAPHHTVRALCVYLIGAAGLWLLMGLTMGQQSHLGHEVMPVLAAG